MKARIKPADIDYVKQQTNIVDIVSDQVALKSAGIDSMKGLCPFHEERTPSFHVKPSSGFYHCFGCGESGDTIKFLQMTDHLSFVEAVERMAQKIGYQLTYEESFGQPAYTGPNKNRLLEANMHAASFFAAQLNLESASNVRGLLHSRGFDDAALKRFGVGFAPDSWDALGKYLRSHGFFDEELIAAGLVAQGNRGTYDRFRDRLVWPIRDASGQVLGFGARKLADDQEGPKYLNTPETPVYHKSKVLYGIDLAKKQIATTKTVVVVEGYTDVMACHLAGITTAVATCGTAFGQDHIAMLRRMMADDTSAQVIFTFDPDEAGQKAALRAFANEHMFRAQTYVAISAANLDPADLRQHHGDEALRNLFKNLKPLFAFALEQAVNKFDLNTVEGRVFALREAAPIVASIKDPAAKIGYTRELAVMLGVGLEEVRAAVSTQDVASGTFVSRSKQTTPRLQMQSPDGSASQENFAKQALGEISLRTSRQKEASPGYRLERDAISAMLQLPKEVGNSLMHQAVTAQLDDNDLRVVRDAIAQHLDSIAQADFLDRVLQTLPAQYQNFLRELAVLPIPHNKASQLQNYARGIVSSLLERDLLALKREMVARLQRLPDTASEQYRQTQEQIRMLEQARRSLQAETK